MVTGCHGVGRLCADATDMIRTFERQRTHHRRRARCVQEDVEPLEQGSAAAELRHDLAEILDEIDTALEENADELEHR